MSLAESRSKRNNAGTRLARLLDDEEEDEFYKTLYGGFEEVSQPFRIFFDLLKPGDVLVNWAIIPYPYLD